MFIINTNLQFIKILKLIAISDDSHTNKLFEEMLT